jgi:TetR/AcrR family transcriptional regulator, cholesterol catabolism regulator
VARKPAEQSVNREDILQAAAEVLRRNGYEATTMKDIAAQVNLTAASLYHHFSNKDALLLAVLEVGLEYAIDQIEPIIASDRPYSEKLREMVRTHVGGVTRNTIVGAAMVSEMRPLITFKAPPRGTNGSTENGDDAYEKFNTMRDHFFQLRDRFEELFRLVVREGIDAGEFAQVDVPIFVKTMLGAQNWIGVWYKPEGALTGDQIADLMADTFLNALRPENIN